MPDLSLGTDAPTVIKWLVWASVGVAAIISIWKNLGSKIVQDLIQRELTTNGGTSVKDKVNSAAKDSKEDLELTKGLARRVEILEHEATELKQDFTAHIQQKAHHHE